MTIKGPVVDFIAERLAEADPSPIALSALREVDGDFGTVLTDLKHKGLQFEIFESPPDSNAFYLDIKGGYDALLIEEEKAAPEREIVSFRAKKLNISKLKGGDIKFSCIAMDKQKDLASFVIDCNESIDLLSVEIIRAPEGATSKPQKALEEDADLDNITTSSGPSEPDPADPSGDNELTPEEMAAQQRKAKEREVLEDPTLSKEDKEASINLMRGYVGSDVSERSGRI
jgi:hypothetical protein